MFVDCGLDDNPDSPAPKNSSPNPNPNAQDQSTVFVDANESFNSETSEKFNQPEQITEETINQALSNEFLFDFVDCSDEFIGDADVEKGTS